MLYGDYCGLGSIMTSVLEGRGRGRWLINVPILSELFHHFTPLYLACTWMSSSALLYRHSTWANWVAARSSDDSRGCAEAQGYGTALQTLIAVGLRALKSPLRSKVSLSKEDHSSSLQESLLLTSQRWGPRSSIANWQEGCHGNGFEASECAGIICVQPRAHSVLWVSKLFLLLCQAEVSLAHLLPAGSMLLSSPRLDLSRGQSAVHLCRNQEFSC